jgi:hypothetical protein
MVKVKFEECVKELLQKIRLNVEQGVLSNAFLCLRSFDTAIDRSRQTFDPSMLLDKSKLCRD